MKNLLVVVDMQNDFIDGALGSPEAVAIVPSVREKIESFQGCVWFTRDTHAEDYLDTQEGKHLPVRHCIKDTEGWQICDALLPFAEHASVIDKPSFGSVELCETLAREHQADPIEKIVLVGLCTDICVISNAMLLKAYLPETVIAVDAACCAGVTPESHERALQAMASCQIVIENT